MDKDKFPENTAARFTNLVNPAIDFTGKELALLELYAEPENDGLIMITIDCAEPSVYYAAHRIPLIKLYTAATGVVQPWYRSTIGTLADTVTLSLYAPPPLNQPPTKLIDTSNTQTVTALIHIRSRL